MGIIASIGLLASLGPAVFLGYSSFYQLNVAMRYKGQQEWWGFCGGLLFFLMTFLYFLGNMGLAKRKEFGRKAVLFSAWFFWFSVFDLFTSIRISPEYYKLNVLGKFWWQLSARLGAGGLLAWAIIYVTFITYYLLTRKDVKEQFKKVA